MRRGQHLFRGLFPEYVADGYPVPADQWWYEAKCRGISAEDQNRKFFPSTHANSPKAVYPETKKICNACPVKDDCLEAAIREERGHTNGMRGGKTPEERKAIWIDRKRHKGLKRENGTPSRPTQKGN